MLIYSLPLAQGYLHMRSQAGTSVRRAEGLDWSNARYSSRLSHGIAKECLFVESARGGGAVVDTSEGARYDIPDYILPDREASSKRGGVRYWGTGNDRQAQTSDLSPLVFAFHGQTCNFYQHRLLHYHRPSTHPLGHLRPPPPTPTCWDLHLCIVKMHSSFFTNSAPTKGYCNCSDWYP